MASSMTFCGNCSAQNPASERFCFSCGYALQTSGAVASTPSTPTGRLLAHTLLRQRYLVLQSIGQGGMGAVYLAQDTQLGDRLVAIKEMGLGNLSGQQAH